MSGAGWDLAQDNFMAHCGAEKGLATASLEAIRFDLARLRRWSEAEGIAAPTSIRDHHLRSFLMESAGELGPSSRARLLSTMRSFFRFLVAEDLTKVDPTTTLIAPRRGRKLPAVLTLNQVERLLETVDGARPGDLRDRAILEVLYGCGCRVSELCGLDVTDLDRSEATLLLRGKGRKQRLVPVGEPALEAVGLYLRAGRPDLIGKAGCRAVPEPAGRPPFPGFGMESHQKIRGRCRSAGKPFTPYPTPYLRHTPFGGGRRPADSAGVTGPRRHRNHRNLHPYRPGLADRGLVGSPSQGPGEIGRFLLRAAQERSLTWALPDGTVSRSFPRY